MRRGVGRQVEAVEAGVSTWQRLHAAPALDAEAPRARRAAQRRESLVRYRRCSRHELHQPQTLLVREPVNGLPEPDNDGMSVVVAAAVLRVVPPVGHVQLWSAGYHQL